MQTRRLTLARLYYHGKGVPQNNAQSASWYRKAAEQSNAEAQRFLVYVYRYGVSGVPKDDSQVRYWETKNFEQFRKNAAAWRARSPRPPLPEEARRELVLAENAVQEKNFSSAFEHYRNGVSLFETWPDGWSNMAFIAGELKLYSEALDCVKRYLELVPDAPDAQTARDQMIIWEDKAKH